MKWESNLLLQFVFVTIIILGFNNCQKITDDVDNDELITDNSDNEELISLTGKRFHQSMEIVGQYGVFVVPTGNVLESEIWDIKSREKISSVELPVPIDKVPHANSLSSSNLYYSKSSFLPLLYLSEWDGNRQCLVYDVTFSAGKYVSTLIQSISPSRIDPNLIGAGQLNWVVDAKNNYLYSFAYKLPNSYFIVDGNEIKVTKFKLPQTDSKIVNLEENDIIDMFSIDIINTFQDSVIHSDTLYIISGYPGRITNMITAIDLDRKKVVSKKILQNINSEPEGLSFYKSKLYVNTSSPTDKLICIDHLSSIIQ